MVQSVVQKETNGMRADMSSLSVSQDDNMTYERQCELSEEMFEYPEPRICLPISVVKKSLSVFSKPMTPAKDSIGGCQSGSGRVLGTVTWADVFPEVSKMEKRTQPWNERL